MSENKITNVLMSGVGGQGVILASDVAAVAAGTEREMVKQTEVHGVAQRGGSVVSHIRFGDKVYAPTVRVGEADVLLAFEKLESVRYCHYVKKDTGVIIVNDLEVMPGMVGETVPYPTGIIEFMQDKGYKVIVVPASKVAEGLGNFRVTSIVMLGVLSNFIDLSEAAWMDTLKERIPAKLMEINLKAFEEGQKLGREALNNSHQTIVG
ncbi:MAG: indolepyruvate oxidoreductase subunit beta [Clostridia bacterium]|nr:indolepyruvate oxidoreductase subunit beta [Clostridia bacterium]